MIASAWGPNLTMIDEAHRPHGHCLYLHATAMVDSDAVREVTQFHAAELGVSLERAGRHEAA